MADLGLKKKLKTKQSKMTKQIAKRQKINLKKRKKIFTLVMN
jgi:hypothetical protein